MILRLNSGGGAKLGSNPNVSERFGFFAISGLHSSRWNVTDSDGVNDFELHHLATSSGAIFRFTLTSAEVYSFEIRSLDGGSTLLSQSGTVTGVVGTAIDILEILMYGNGSGNGLTGTGASPTGQRELVFNDFLIESSISLVGDYNSDGAVDAADYTIWRDTLGSTTNLAANGNTVIDAEDYDVWKQNFGDTSGSGSRAEVPEPATLVLLIMGMLVFIVRRAALS